MMEKSENTSGIISRNAGLVLLNHYIPLLFERLDLTADKKFPDITNQSKAVHYLQYAVTGLNSAEEPLLGLNKVLCGLPLAQTVESEIFIPTAHKTFIEEMISAVIANWPEIGHSSIDGFRGNWLVRDGLLTEKDDRWELRVEKRAYDILLDKLPFSFSIIKYPWMSKPLHVQWR